MTKVATEQERELKTGDRVANGARVLDAKPANGGGQIIVCLSEGQLVTWFAKWVANDKQRWGGEWMACQGNYGFASLAEALADFEARS